MPDDDNLFTEQFNLGLDDVEPVTNAVFQYPVGTEWPVISIDDMKLSDVVGAPGGRLTGIKLTIWIRRAIQEASGVGKGKVILARGEKARVMSIIDDGDDAVGLVSGPVGAQLPQE